AILHARGMVYARNKDYDRALADLNAAIDAFSDGHGVVSASYSDWGPVTAYRTDNGAGELAKIHGDRGLLWRAKGDQKSALADFNESLRLMPGQPGILLERAAIWGNQQNFARLAEDALAAQQAAPTNPKAHYLHSLALLMQREFTRAEEEAAQ